MDIYDLVFSFFALHLILGGNFALHLICNCIYVCLITRNIESG